jgi:hypothetical protein
MPEIYKAVFTAGYADPSLRVKTGEKLFSAVDMGDAAMEAQAHGRSHGWLVASVEYVGSLEITPTLADISPSDVEWVVADDGDLGVKIGGKVFTLYKGESLERADSGSRPVGKREFGESVRSKNTDL